MIKVSEGGKKLEKKNVEISQLFSTLYPPHERTEFLDVSAASIFLTTGNGFTMRLAGMASRSEREIFLWLQKKYPLNSVESHLGSLKGNTNG